MSALKLVITILQLLCGLAIIVAVLFQSGKSAGLSGAIGGVADSFLAKNKAKTLDAKLARATKWVGAVFLILTLILLIMGCFSLRQYCDEKRNPPNIRGIPFYVVPVPVRYSFPASGVTPFSRSSSSTVTKQ